MRSKSIKKLMAFALTAAMAASSFGSYMPLRQVHAAEAEEVGTRAQKAFYVATNGKDTNNGSVGSPFATIDRAREEVAKMNSDMKGDIDIYIAPGDYYLDDTVQFDVQDSGTNGYNINYISSGGPGAARLIGGKNVKSGGGVNGT